MHKVRNTRILILPLILILLNGCGAKDNLVEGMDPESGNGSGFSALGASTGSISGKGATHALGYGKIFLQKLVETADLFSFVEQLSDRQQLECGAVSQAGDRFTIDYFSQNNSGECQDYLSVGYKKFITTIKNNSSDTFEIKRVGGVVESVKLIKSESQVNFSVGAHRAPKRFMNIDGSLVRSYRATHLSCPEGKSGVCYAIVSRLLLQIDDLVFSPSKNAPIKFKEQGSSLDFRFDFILRIDGNQRSISMTNRANQLFMMGSRQSFVDKYPQDYNGKLYLKDMAEGQEFILHGESGQSSCGYLAEGVFAFGLKWGRSPVRSMERKFALNFKFSTSEIISDVANDRGTSLYQQVEQKSRCQAGAIFSQSGTAPFYNNYLLFSY